jgi:hypothetical protein
MCLVRVDDEGVLVAGVCAEYVRATVAVAETSIH